MFCQDTFLTFETLVSFHIHIKTQIYLEKHQCFGRDMYFVNPQTGSILHNLECEGWVHSFYLVAKWMVFQWSPIFTFNFLFKKFFCHNIFLSLIKSQLRKAILPKGYFSIKYYDILVALRDYWFLKKY